MVVLMMIVVKVPPPLSPLLKLFRPHVATAVVSPTWFPAPMVATYALSLTFIFRATITPRREYVAADTSSTLTATPNLATIVQALVKRFGWSSGNSVLVACKTDPTNSQLWSFQFNAINGGTLCYLSCLWCVFFFFSLLTFY